MAFKTTVWDGKTISKPGIYSKIGLDVYHRGDICAGPSVSSSGLRKLFAQSPAHFYAEWPGNSKHIERPDKKNLVLGRAAHHLFLGEDYFSTLFAAQPPEYPDGKTGELKKWTYQAQYCKDWREGIERQGKSIITPDMEQSIRGMARALERHQFVQLGLLNGMIERSIFFKDKETGLWIKVRPDSIPTDSVDFVDLKTTQSVLWLDLQKTIAKYAYHQQGALMRRAAREVLGIANATFTLVFVEVEIPHCVRVVQIKSSELDRGEKQNRAALDAVARCIASGHWPGPGGEREDARDIELPEWSQKQIDDRLEYGIST